MLIIQQALTHPQSETNSHVSKIHVVSNLIKVPFAFKSNSTTSLSPISKLHRKLKKQSLHTAQHSTAQHNATDLRSKPQCASLISWSEVTHSLSLSLCFFSDFMLIENFTRFIMVLNRYQSFFLYMDLSAPFWFPLHSLTMYWMSDRFCLFCSLFLILDLDLAFEVQFLFNSTMTKLIIGDLKFRSSLFVSLDIGEEKGVEFIGSFLIWDWMLYYAVT